MWVGVSSINPIPTPLRYAPLKTNATRVCAITGVLIGEPLIDDRSTRRSKSAIFVFNRHGVKKNTAYFYPRIQVCMLYIRTCALNRLWALTRKCFFKNVFPKTITIDRRLAFFHFSFTGYCSGVYCI